MPVRTKKYVAKVEEVNKLVQQVSSLQFEVRQEKRWTTHYKNLWEHLDSIREPTIEEQLVEARRINKELTDKRALKYIMKQNQQLAKETN